MQAKKTNRTSSRLSFKEGLKSIAYANPIYNLTLKTRKFINLNYVPNDLWPGNADHGMAMINHQYHFAGQTIRSGIVPWAHDDVPDDWIKEIHGFEWLRNLKAVGGDIARRKARTMVEDWLRDYETWTSIVWAPEVISQRIWSWLSFYNFAFANGDEIFRDKFITSLGAQSKHLLRIFPAKMEGIERLKALRAVLGVHICLPLSSVSEDRIQYLIEQEASAQIWQDGLHISRNASTHLQALMILIDIRTLLQGAQVTPPNSLSKIIERMTATLKFMRHGDGKLCVFAGSKEEEEIFIEAVLSASTYKGKETRSLKQSGYSKVTMGRSNIFMDIGPEGPDIRDWTSSGAIEFSSGKQRIFVNCGTTSFNSPYTDLMKKTVASSTLTLDEDSTDFTNYQGFDVEPRHFTMHENHESCLIELSHAGFYEEKGIIHHRRIFIGNNGDDIRGEDILEGPDGHSYSVRFHLHPSVKASLIQDGYELYLSPPKGNAFRFLGGGHPIRLEESIYFGDGETPRKTQQIVIEGQTIPKTTAIQWAIQKETGN